jgi:P-type E1-E2 ATPase
MAKEALEDFHRFQADREVNKRAVLVYNPITKTWERKQWRDLLVSPPHLTSEMQGASHSSKAVLVIFTVTLQVGEVVKVERDSFFPADLLLLSSTNDDGIAYVETVNLDGESNLKIKKALDQTKGLSQRNITNFKVHTQVSTSILIVCLKQCLTMPF